MTKGLFSSFHSEFITANVKKTQKKYAQGYRTQQSCSGRQQHSVHKGRQSGSFPKLSSAPLSQNACFALFQQVRVVGSPFPTRAPFPCGDGSATTALPSLGFGLYLLSRNCPSTEVLSVTLFPCFSCFLNILLFSLRNFLSGKKLSLIRRTAVFGLFTPLSLGQELAKRSFTPHAVIS